MIGIAIKTCLETYLDKNKDASVFIVTAALYDLNSTLITSEMFLVYASDLIMECKIKNQNSTVEKMGLRWQCCKITKSITECKQQTSEDSDGCQSARLLSTCDHKRFIFISGELEDFNAFDSYVKAYLNESDFIPNKHSVTVLSLQKRDWQETFVNIKKKLKCLNKTIKILEVLKCTK